MVFRTEERNIYIGAFIQVKDELLYNDRYMFTVSQKETSSEVYLHKW